MGERQRGSAIAEIQIPRIPHELKRVGMLRHKRRENRIELSGRLQCYGNTVIYVAPATARRLPRKAPFVGFAGLNKAAMVVAFGMTSRMNSTNWGPGFDVCLAVAAV
jgi:hypothetical protein